jgi:5'-nucleotidase
MRAQLLRIAFVSSSLAIGSCGPSAASRPDERPRVVTISVVGTNDLHGHVEALPALSGYLAILRAAREADGGAVVLLDGGDMFQGTLESNLAEGAPVVAA